MTTTYRLIPGSELTLTINEAQQTETWANQKTHFLASWNGDAEDAGLFPTGTGALISMGFQPAPALTIEKWQDRCPKNFTPGIDSGDYKDGKHDTNGTGGSERGFVCSAMSSFAWQRQDWQDAYKSLVGFCMDQFHRPYSMVPWQFGTKLSHWQSSNRTSNSLVNGWNRTDRAHASRPQLYALATLGSDLGLMMAALEWRTLASDWLQETVYVLDQPREVAWMLQWCDWAEELGFNDSGLPVEMNGDPFFPKPFRIRETLLGLLAASWWSKHPVDKAAAQRSTDAKVLPRSSAATYECAGEYTWHAGMMLTALTHLPLPLTGFDVDAFAENLYRGFNSTVAPEFQRWCESTGTTEFTTRAAADAVVAGVLKEADRLKLRVWTLPNGNFHIVKPRSSDDAYFFAEGYARLYGLSHPACLAMIRQFGDKKADNYGLAAGFWRMLEIAGTP